MRIHILLMLVSVLFFSNAVKAQNFVWGQKMGSSNFDVGSDIDTDSSGNSVVVGTFYASTTIDAITLTASGSSDGFVAKLDASGDAIWAIAIGGIGQEDVKSVKVDQSTGDIYITGNYSAAFTLGGTVLPYTTWGNDVFLAKLSSTGSVLWAKGFTGTFSDYACDVAIDEANGYVYAFGAFDSNFTIGTTSFNSSNFQTDLYLAKYSTSGSFIWARQFIAGDVYTSGLGTKYGGIGVLSNGDVAIASNFRGYITMDGFSLAATGGSQFSYDVLIARVGSDGTTVWAKNAGGSSTDYGNDLAIDSADNLWLTGRTAGATTFGTINLPASGTSAAFIAKYDSAGVAQYAYQTGGGSINDGNGIDVDALGNVYLIGRYYSAITFGSIILTSSNTGSKLFLAKLNASTSTWEWAIGPDYSGSYSPAEEGKAIAVGDEDDVFLTGIFSGTIKLANQILVTAGSYDIFIAKVGDCSTLSAGINTLGSTTICSGGSVGFYADTSSLYEYQWLFNNASLPGQINYNYSANQAGNYSVVIDSLGCLDTSSVVSVIVGTTPIVTQSALGTYCENAAPFALTGGLPAGGIYSGTGVSGGVFSPSVAGPGTHPITYTYTNSDGCSASASQTISVTASPFVFMLAQPSVCEDDTPFALASGIPGGGIYSGTGVTGGLVFNPAVAGVGTHKVYYTRITGSCSTTDSVNVVVNGVPNVNMGALADVCITTSFTPLIGGTPGGGTYSGPGVSSPFFFPLAAGAGEHNIVYTVTQSGCSSSDTATIQVDLVPNPIMAPLPDLCENDADLNLNIYVFPSGGVFTGPSVVDSIFSPQVFGAGTDTIVYTIANACGIDTAMRPITVNPSPNVSVLAFAPVCVDAGIQSLSGGSPLGGTFSGSGVVGGTFNPQTAGVGTHTITYTYTNASGCADSASNTITVNPLPVVTLSAFADVCIDAGTQTLSGGLPAGGTYFGT
ncbi:MAG: hypothetical protein NWR83_09615, partial [Salibacteraceae bacterium]|nr:hypothetical protein [Salibacteraceae bacterium]